jgi:hypothetical protein
MWMPTLTPKQAARCLLLVPLLAFVSLYQLRSSFDTVRLVRTLDLYVPFLIDPFTSRADVLYTGEQLGDRASLRRGDQILRVNGKPFTGMSLYLRELWEAQHRPPSKISKPFFVTVLSHDSRVHTIEFGVPHCTCGTLSDWQAVILWVISPMFCILVGFTTVALRPLSILAWAYLGLMLSLSQLQFWPEPMTGFQLTATPMLWPDWFRIPGVGYKSFVQTAWPAALLTGLVAFTRSSSGPRRFSGLLIGIFLSFAALQSALAIAWSENFRMLAPLYRWFEEYRTESIVASLAGIAALAWVMNWRAGLAASCIAIIAITGLFWSAAPITKAEWTLYSDNTRRLEPILPGFHNTPQLILLTALVAYLLAIVIVFRKNISWRPFVGPVLCLPLAVHVGASVGNFYYPFGFLPFEDWPWFVMATAGCGIAWTALWIVRKHVAGDHF